jgi:hypothetical protein
MSCVYWTALALLPPQQRARPHRLKPGPTEQATQYEPAKIPKPASRATKPQLSTQLPSLPLPNPISFYNSIVPTKSNGVEVQEER